MGIIINDDNTCNIYNNDNSHCFCLWGSISYNQAPTHRIGKTKVKVRHPLFDFGKHGYLLRARSCAGVVLACLIYFCRTDISFFILILTQHKDIVKKMLNSLNGQFACVK